MNKENEVLETMIYSVQEVAKILHSSPNYIYLLIEKGYLPAIKLKSVKILKTSLESFLKLNEGKDFSNLSNVKDLDISCLDRNYE